MNNISRSTRTLALLLAVIAFPATAWADLVLEWQVDVTRVRHPSSNKQPDEKRADDSEKKPVQPEITHQHEKWTVVLGDNYLQVDDGVSNTICDFTKRRMYMVSAGSDSYNVTSLYAVVGFRGPEFENRKRLSEILTKAGVKEMVMPRVLTEHLLSIAERDESPELVKDSRVGWTVYSWQGLELLGYGGEIVPTTPQQRDAFVRFLTYRTAGHPDILKDLRSVNGIPSKLNITLRDVGMDVTRTLTLVSHEERADQAYVLPAKRVEPDDELKEILTLAHDLTPEKVVQHSQQILKEAETDMQQGRLFDAMLGWLEYGLTSGDQSGKAIRGNLEELGKNADCVELFGALEPKTKEEAEKSVKTLAALRGKSQSRMHVLMIFEANTRTGLKDPGEASKLFRAALKDAPHIAGAWKDLGDIYYGSYNMPNAWRCWDAARQMAPQHPMLKDFDKFEQMLVTRHPEYF
jgi:hypothetical protein